MDANPRVGGILRTSVGAIFATRLSRFALTEPFHSLVLAGCSQVTKPQAVRAIVDKPHADRDGQHGGDGHPSNWQNGLASKGSTATAGGLRACVGRGPSGANGCRQGLSASQAPDEPGGALVKQEKRVQYMGWQLCKPNGFNHYHLCKSSARQWNAHGKRSAWYASAGQG